MFSRLLNLSNTVSGRGLLVSKKAKIVNRKTINIEWGDCDPAQIVHFPRYFAYFDACTTALFQKAGLSKREMVKTYRIVGIPLVDVQASFMVPSRFSDTVIVESEISEWGSSSFRVRHRLFNKDILAVECIETRVWAVAAGAHKDQIKGKPVPREVVEMFSPGTNPGQVDKKARRKR